MSDWSDYFQENMDAVPLVREMGPKVSLLSVSNLAGAINNVIEKWGRDVTVRELAIAGLNSERLVLGNAVYASYYLGAVVGSAAVATGRVLGKGTSLADVLFRATTMGVHSPLVHRQILVNPRFYKASSTPKKR